MVPSFASAINFTNGTWSTTFNYGPCSQRGDGGLINCDSVTNDGLLWTWGGPLGSNYTYANSLANYPGGGGGNGLRQWKADGSNVLSGQLKAVLPSPQRTLDQMVREMGEWRKMEPVALHQIDVLTYWRVGGSLHRIYRGQWLSYRQPTQYRSISSK